MTTIMMRIPLVWVVCVCLHGEKKQLVQVFNARTRRPSRHFDEAIRVRFRPRSVGCEACAHHSSSLLREQCVAGPCRRTGVISRRLQVSVV